MNTDNTIRGLKIDDLSLKAISDLSKHLTTEELTLLSDYLEKKAVKMGRRMTKEHFAWFMDAVPQARALAVRLGRKGEQKQAEFLTAFVYGAYSAFFGQVDEIGMRELTAMVETLVQREQENQKENEDGNN